MSTGSQPLRSMLDKLWRSPTVRKFASQIRSDHVQGAQSPRTFTKDQAYFQIRLSEMFLRDDRELWRNFLPVTVCMTEFNFNGKQQVVPFIVSNEILKSIEKYADGNRVDYRNTRLTLPIPYIGGDVSVFVGLYRITRTDLALNFFSFMGSIVKVFDTSGITKYVELAGPLSVGLEQFLGMADVEFRVGTRQAFGDSKPADSAFREGYWVFMNCAENAVDPNTLWVKDGQLKRIGISGESHFDQNDYCLIQIEYLEERNDYTVLPFHAQWEAAKTLIWNGETEKAKAKFMVLAQELAVSPDLTKKHRISLMLVYKANFESELELYLKQSLGLVDAPEIQHRADSSGIRAKDSIQRQGIALEKAHYSKEVVSGVYLVQELLPLTNPMQSLDDRSLNNQLAKVQNLIRDRIHDNVPEPAELANGMAISTFMQ